MEEELLHHSLTRKIIGTLFAVNKELGFGYKEKTYQEAIAKDFETKGISFKRENFSRVSYKGKRVGCFFQDFLVEQKVILEIKIGRELFESYVKQTLSYMRDYNVKVGIVAVFTPAGVLYKRLIV